MSIAAQLQKANSLAEQRLDIFQEQLQKANSLAEQRLQNEATKLYETKKRLQDLEGYNNNVNEVYEYRVSDETEKFMQNLGFQVVMEKEFEPQHQVKLYDKYGARWESWTAYMPIFTLEAADVCL